MGQKGMTDHRFPRLPDWPARLEQAIAAWRDRPISWGDNCALFAGDCVLAQTGVDPLGGIRATMRTAQGWAAILRANGGSLAGVVNGRLGPPLGRLHARRGDVVGVTSGRGLGGGLALGVCAGDKALFLDRAGLQALALRDADLCWRVG